MTISSTTRVVQYTGNGSAATFAFSFKVFAAADLLVVRNEISTGTQTVLLLNTDYTVTLNANQNSPNPGGSITLVAGALASTYTLTISSAIQNLQPTDLTNQGGFYPEVITDSLDRATIQIQQLEQATDRTLVAPLVDGSIDMTIPATAARAGKFLTFDTNGVPTVSTGTGNDTALRTDLANNTVVSAGASLVGYRPTASTSSTRTVLTKLRDLPVSVKDFGAIGNGVANDTAAFNAAWTASTPAAVFIPAGTYVISGTVTGTFYSHGNVTISGGTVNTITTYSANTTIPGTLGVTGNSTLGGTLAVTGNTTVGGTLGVTGNSTLSGTLAVTGNTTLTGDLAVNGADITTTETGTANIFNTNVANINIGQAANYITVGANNTVLFGGYVYGDQGFGTRSMLIPVRAWANAGSFAQVTSGGWNAATATRTAGSTTCTINCSLHGLATGQYVSTFTAGQIEPTVNSYQVTVTDVSTFTITTPGATGALSNSTVAFGQYAIRRSYGIHSIVRRANTAGQLLINFRVVDVLFPDNQYIVTGNASDTTNSTTAAYVLQTQSSIGLGNTANVAFINVRRASNEALSDFTQLNFAVIR
jgi:hypothetical protein